jgi:hypothetical protein
MELTSSFLDLRQHFAPVFTAPTYQTFVAIVEVWVLSQRHRFITEVICSGGNIGHGHWSRFHCFFSHAACDGVILDRRPARGPPPDLRNWNAERMRPTNRFSCWRVRWSSRSAGGSTTRKSVRSY